MTIEDGAEKIIHCSLALGTQQPAFPILLRKAGRFVIKEGDDFAYLSDSKTKTITINGSVSGTSEENLCGDIEASPTLTEFAQGDLIPQDVINEFGDIEELDVVGLFVVPTGSLSSANVKLFASSLRTWISMQPMSAWNDEDEAVLTSTFNSLPGGYNNSDGLMSTTTHKVSHPFFIPIKQPDAIRKNLDKFYLYTRNSASLNYANGVTSISGSITYTFRVVLARGYLPETIEELLSVHQ